MMPGSLSHTHSRVVVGGCKGLGFGFLGVIIIGGVTVVIVVGVTNGFSPRNEACAPYLTDKRPETKNKTISGMQSSTGSD